MTSEHYFDWAATSPEDSEILHEALDIAIKCFGNPSSTHAAGKEARAVFEEARKRAAKAIGVKPEQVFFTSGGTESDHIPLLSVLTSPQAEAKNAKKGRIILSAIEHPALREQCRALEHLGFEVVQVFPDKNGFISAESVLEKLTPDTLFVTVMAVNNETGCVQPIYEIADALTKASNGKKRPHFHVDCVQAAGKIPLNLGYKGIDSAALSSHKICGPRGIGLLYLARQIKPFLVGGGQEGGVRSGTENLFGAVAFSKCLEKYFINAELRIKNEELSESKTGENLGVPLSGRALRGSADASFLQAEAKQGSENKLARTANAAAPIPNASETKQAAAVVELDANAYKRFLLQKNWTNDFISKLSSLKNCVLVPEIRANLDDEVQSRFSPWVLQAAFKGIPGNVMLRALDAKGFYISTGSACSSKKQSRPILAAMNASRDIQDSAVRFSFGPLTTQKAMDELFDAVKEIYNTFNN